MYGTIARLRARAGSEGRLRQLMAEYEDLAVAGFAGTSVYRMDADPNEYYLAVAFEDRKSYAANAADPAQDARYRKLRELLEADPEWHDGEIVWTSARR
ncbi:MAG: putative quinol monooxygenase [Candidatus Limnocylindria bacterium]